MELVGQNVSIRTKVILRPAEFLLHFHEIKAEAVFSRNFVAHWKVIDALEFVEALVEEALAGAAGPQDVPLVGLCEIKAVGFEQ